MIRIGTCKCNSKEKTNRGPRLTPTGLRPQHPGQGGTEGGNAQQHETQVAAQELTESDSKTNIVMLFRSVYLASAFVPCAQSTFVASESAAPMAAICVREDSGQRPSLQGCTSINDTSVGVAAVGHEGVRDDIEVTLPQPHGPTLLNFSMHEM
jgi:hypothetical protein